ncbi:MAG: hypothetical protein ACYC3X_26640 [Pirellulaceae bacterium]
MSEHDTHYEIRCRHCHVISHAALPLLVCPACHCHDAVAVLTTDMLPLATSEAFKPGSPHWGCHPSPVAKVIEHDEVAT